MVDVQLRSQPRIDVLVTDFASEERRLRTDYAGVAWLGDEPDDETGLLGTDYSRRDLESRLFLPDTHWYDADALDDVEVQVTAGVLQVAPTKQGTQGLLGPLAEPEIEFYEHPDEADGLGVCLVLRGEIRSNVGLSYRVTLVCDPAAVLRRGEDMSDAAAVSAPLDATVADAISDATTG